MASGTITGGFEFLATAREAGIPISFQPITIFYPRETKPARVPIEQFRKSFFLDRSEYNKLAGRSDVYLAVHNSGHYEFRASTQRSTSV